MDKLKQSSFEQKMHDLENDLSNIFQDANDMEKNQQRANIKQLLNEWQEKKERDHFTNEVSPKIVDLMEKEALKEGISSYSIKNQKGNVVTYTVKSVKDKRGICYTYSIEDAGIKNHKMRDEFLRSFNRTAVNSIVGTARETVSKPFREKDHLIDRCM